MKVIIKENNKEKVYIQVNDIVFILSHEINIPENVKNDFNNKLKTNTSRYFDDNPYTFKLFTDTDTISFISNLEYIIDYEDYKRKTKAEIYEDAYVIQDKKKELAVKFNELSIADREKNQDIVKLCDEIDYEIMTIRDILWFKEGHINMIIPGSRNEKQKIKKLSKKNINKTPN